MELLAKPSKRFSVMIIVRALNVVSAMMIPTIINFLIETCCSMCPSSCLNIKRCALSESIAFVFCNRSCSIGDCEIELRMTSRAFIACGSSSAMFHSKGSIFTVLNIVCAIFAAQ